MDEVHLHDLTFVPFISADAIEKTVRELAAKIDRDYQDRNPILLIVLNGAFIFAADLVRKITIPIQLDFVKLSSYQGTSSSGKMNEHFLWQTDLKGKDVIIVEDIVDRGHTLFYLKEKIKQHQPATIEVACLLKKPEAYQYTDIIRYEGICIPNDFVVGYGLDYDGLGRDLDSIYRKKDA
jgi:hypoxanthine phosphoribosyltransferase